jgi:hypothetical protein
MFVLIDWDNLDQNLRRQGARYVADRIWTTLESSMSSYVQTVSRLDVRLYGGWYGPLRLTKYGAQMAAEVQKDFPFVLRNAFQGINVTIGCELAQALLQMPKHTLPHTYRPRQGPPRLDCAHRTDLGCSDASCPILVVNQFFNAGTCPGFNCTRTITNILGRNEQKLVDTMLVSDVIYLAHLGESPVAVVSSDDDLWPGMLTAMHQGCHIIQLCTKYASSHKLYQGTRYGRYSHERL